MDKSEINKDIYYDSLRFNQKIETSLAEKVGMSELRSGAQVIRNERGWRENERIIKYIWITTFARSFTGWGGIFSIRYDKNIFRNYTNPEELTQGVFLIENNRISDIYFETLKNSFQDKVADTISFNLFGANNGISHDGVDYTFRIIANGIDTVIKMHNPNIEEWKTWEEQIFNLGKHLVSKSNNMEMIKLFEKVK